MDSNQVGLSPTPDGEARRLRDAIGRVAVAMARETDWAKATHTVLGLAEDALGADVAAIWRADPEAAVLRLVAVRGVSEADLSSAQEVRYDARLYIAAAAREGLIQVIEELEMAPLADTMIPLWQSLGFHSAVAVPLPGRGRLAGVMLYLTMSPRRYDENALAAIDTIAEIFGLGLDNAWLHTELDAIVQNEPTMVATWALRPNGDVYLVKVNDAYCHLVGHRREHLEGRLVTEEFPRRLLEGHPLPDLLRQVLREGRPIQVAEQASLTSGERAIYVRAKYAPLKDPEGRVVAGIFTGEDVTAEVEARRELERRTAELDAVIENVNEGIMIVDPQQRVARVNRRELDLFGLAPEQAPATLADLERFKPRTRDGKPLETDELPVMRALRGESFTDEEFLVDTADGRARHLMEAGGPVRDAEGQVALAVVVNRDITAIRVAEREREDFLRAVSHDLRGPLTSVLGQAQLLQRKPDSPVVVERGATVIVDGARRMNAMIDDLTDMARLELGKMKPRLRAADLREFVADYLQVAGSSLDTSRIQLEAPDALPPVQADHDWLARVLENLLSNALKYSNPGSEVLLRMRAEDDQVVCEVTDQGPGLAFDEVSHIFERYYRTAGASAHGDGLGLGLYITRLFLQHMGGRVWATSEVGKGSTFGFALPRSTRSKGSRVPPIL